MARVLDIEEWEEYIFNELTSLGYAVNEEMIQIITEISLDFFEQQDLLNYRLFFGEDG